MGEGDPHSFHAFHSLLLRTLVRFIHEGKKPTQTELGCLLAVLPRLPLCSASHDHFDDVLGALRTLLQAQDWTKVLQSQSLDDNHELLDIQVEECFKKRKGRSGGGRGGRGLRKVRTWRLRDSADGTEEEEVEPRRSRKVAVAESILLSESDGFGLAWGETPPDTDRCLADTLNYVYKKVFGSFPTYFSALGSMRNALALVASVSLHVPTPSHAVQLMAECLEKAATTIQSTPDTPKTMAATLNFLRLSRQAAHSCLQLAPLAEKGLLQKKLHSDAAPFPRDSLPSMGGVLDLSSHLLLRLTKEAFLVSQQIGSLLASSSLSSPPRGLLQSMECVEASLLFVWDASLAVVEKLPERREALEQLGEWGVSWLSSSAMGGEWAGPLLASLERRLHPRREETLEQKLLLELLSSLIDNGSDQMVSSVLSLLQHTSFSFSKVSSGRSFLLIFIPILSMGREKAAAAVEVLSLHLPLMDWTYPLSEEEEELSAGGPVVPSRASSLFAQLWKKSEDLKQKQLYSLLKYFSSVDMEMVAVEGVLPRAVSLCQTLVPTQEESSIQHPASPGRLSLHSSTLLQVLEVFAFELKTRHAAARATRDLLRPHCDLLMGVLELRDVFFGIANRASRLSSEVFVESGMLDWVLNRLDLCLRSASIDIWTIVEDSAVTFYRPFSSCLCLVEDLCQHSSESVAGHRPRLLSLTSSIVDLCFEWMSSPSAKYRSSTRISHLLSLSLSTHLLLSKDPNDVVGRFKSGWMGAVGSSPCSLFVSSSLCALIRHSVANASCQQASRLSIDRASTAEEVVQTPSSPPPTRPVIHPELVLACITMLKEVVETSEGSDEGMGWAVERVMKELRVVEREQEEEKEWMRPLTELCHSLLDRHFPSSLLSHPLNVIARLLRRERNPSDLAAFVRFFHHERADDDIKRVVVEEMHRLLAMEEGMPSACLVFPQVAATMEGVDVSSSLPSSPLSKPRALANSATRGGRTILKRLMKSLNVESATAKTRSPSLPSSSIKDSDRYSVGAAAVFRLNDKQSLSSVHGLTLSTWIKREPAPPTEGGEEEHLLSMGGPHLCCTLTLGRGGHLWVTTRASDLQVKRERPEGIRRIGTKKWHHIIFGIRVIPGALSIQVAVDSGMATMEVPLLVKMESSSFSLSIQMGSISRRLSPHYFMANLFGFVGMIPHSNILVLSALGCDLSSLAETRLGHLSPSLAPIICPRLVSYSPISLEEAINKSEIIQIRLQRQQVFCVSAESASSFGVIEMPPDLDPTLLSNETGLSMAFFNEHPMQWRTRLVHSSLPSLHSSFSSIGSLKLIVFLFAKSVNDGQSSRTQLSSLSLLLTARRAFPVEASTLRLDKLICTILSSSTAIVNKEMVELLLSECINDGSTPDEEEVEGSRPPLPSTEKVSTVICDSALFVALACTPDTWTKREECWRMVISKLALLLNESTATYFAFNRFQLGETNGLNRLVHMILKQLHLPDSSFASSSSLVDDLLSILHSLLGSPERYEGVVQLWYLIFLSHPASSSFIEQRVTGPSTWLSSVSPLLEDDVDTQLNGDSELCSILKEYVDEFGRENLQSQWARGSSLLAIRRQFEERRGRDEATTDDDRPLAYSGDVLPDLLSDLGPRSHSDDLASSSSAHSVPSLREHDYPDWVIRLRSGVLLLLSDILQNGPDSLLQCLVHDVISWQAIIVLLTKQPDIRIREAILSTLEKFLLRAPLFTKITFIELRGFDLLSSQLKGGPVSASIADSLFGILCGETVRIQDGLDETRLSEMAVDRVSCGALHAVLVLFSLCVEDSVLFWNVTNALLKMFEFNSQLQAAMAESSLPEIMVSVLRKIARLPEKESEVAMRSGSTSIQLEGWMSLAQRMVVFSFPYNDRRLNAMGDRLLHILRVSDWGGGSVEGKADSLRVHSILRAQLCHLLHCSMESIRTVFSDEGRSASAASSVDSIPSLSSSPTDSFDLCDDVVHPDRAFLVNGTSPFSAFVAGSFANIKEKLISMGPISRRNLRCTYRRRRGAAPLASLPLLHSRLLSSLDIALSIFAVHPQAAVATEEEAVLFHFCLYVMLSSWRREEKPSSSRPESVWHQIMSLSRDRVRVLLAQMVAFILFPAQEKLSRSQFRCGSEWSLGVDVGWAEERRRQLLKALAHELPYKKSLQQLMSVNLDYEFALCLGVYELALLSPLPRDHDEYANNVDRMVQFLRSTNVGCPMDKLTPDCLANLNTDQVLSMHSYMQYRKGVLAALRSKVELVKDEEEVACAQLEQHAMTATCEIVEELNTPRKMHLLLTRECLLDTVESEKTLHLMTKELCHPEACAFSPSCWPVGSSLDRREGATRERRRLSPAYYGFDSRYFKPEVREVVAANKERHPLDNILGGEGASLATHSSSHRTRRVLGEGVQLYLDATLLCGTFECTGELLAAVDGIHFSGDRARTTQKGVECSPIALSWHYEQMDEIFYRNHLLKDVAMEIFLNTGDTFFVVFASAEKRGQLRSFLEERRLGGLFPSREQLLHAFTSTWRHGGSTNFEYLMQLNKLAGRSFNDLMQYPVFPFVLADYSSSVLDLTAGESFRVLARPMAIQDRSMEGHYADNYACIQAECERKETHAPLHFGPYHYGSHYSNSGIVVHYLVRVSPFTQIALEYQDNNFDIPDRLFNSLEATWRLASSESTTDFKELIPEFFFLSEMLENRDKLELGTRQGGESVGDVRLPPWVPDNNPRLFMLIHRQALESSMVTANLHQWVDLIFGYKQTGPAALKALNVFHPATYLGHLDADELSDELSQSALRTMVRTYGQMPLQLLQSPHPAHSGRLRSPESKRSSPLYSVVGVRWGDFVGSPDQNESEVQVILSVQTSPICSRLIHLSEGIVVGVPRSTIILTHSIPSEHGSSRRPQEVLSVLSYSFPDRLLRLRCMRPTLRPWVNVLQLGREGVSNLLFSPSTSFLFVALTHGAIQVYKIEVDLSGLRRVSPVSSLLGHSSGPSALALSDDHSLFLSACPRGKVVVWDSQQLSYVRTLRSSGAAVTDLAVSLVSADIAIVSQSSSGLGSRVEVVTVNGSVVGAVETESTVLSIAMTWMAEGTGVNCLALGLESGVVMMVEMWCLSTVRELVHSSYRDGVVSLSFAARGRKLLAVQSTGRLLCWQSVSSVHRSRPAGFQMIDPFV